MAATAITVRRQILDVEVFGEEADGVLLQRRLPAVCADVVAPALEASLAPVALGAERICIDRIEIDVEGVEFDQLERALADAVRRGVDEYLRDHPFASPDAAAHAGALRRATEREGLEDALVLFLRTGRLPWSFRIPPGDDLERMVLRTWSEQNDVPGPSRALRRRLADVFREPAARARVVLQFTPQFAVALLRGLSTHVAMVGGEALAALDAGTLPDQVRRAFALRVWDAALVAAADGGAPSAGELVRRAARDVALAPADARVLAAALQPRWPDAASTLLEEDREPPGPLQAPETPDGRALGEETEGMLVEEAGLVLLHPYLQRFFEGVGAAEGDELVDPRRAVCLLHLLATGESTAPEHRVTLAKALCGIPLDEPVPADPGLTSAEADEATALLEAVVAHWGALGDASAEGLREGFLQRDGVLSIDAWGDWLLRVESRSLDILIDDLPWSISIVSLPWMDRRLIVEWR